MLHYALTTSLGTEIGFRNSNGVDDSGSDSPSGHGRHVPQRQIPHRSQNQGDSEAVGNGERVEQPAAG